MFKPLFILMLVLTGVRPGVLAQSGADTAKTYTSLEEAIKNPDLVEKLDLSKQKLEVIPQEIFSMANLRELYLGKNRIKTIPADIARLTRLEVLDMSRNKLTAIPTELFSCHRLKKLILNQNLIESVPREIAHLQELEYLDMWSNELETLPNEIARCKKLKEVDLRVINISNTEQQRIAQLLPGAKVYMSPSCNCSH